MKWVKKILKYITNIFIKKCNELKIMKNNNT